MPSAKFWMADVDDLLKRWIGIYIGMSSLRVFYDREHVATWTRALGCCLISLSVSMLYALHVVSSASSSLPLASENRLVRRMVILESTFPDSAFLVSQSDCFVQHVLKQVRSLPGMFDENLFL